MKNERAISIIGLFLGWKILSLYYSKKSHREYVDLVMEEGDHLRERVVYVWRQICFLLKLERTVAIKSQ